MSGILNTLGNYLSEQSTISTLFSPPIPAIKEGPDNELKFQVGDIVEVVGDRSTLKAGNVGAIQDGWIENRYAKYILLGLCVRANELKMVKQTAIHLTKKEWVFVSKLNSLSLSSGFTKEDVKETQGLTLKTLATMLKKFAIVKIDYYNYVVNTRYNLVQERL